MKTAKQDYSVLQQLFGRCEDRDSPDESYRIFAWMRILIAYPFIIFPAWGSIDFFLSLSPYPELSLILIDIWITGHALLVVASLLAFGGSFKAVGERGAQVMRHATLACCVLEAFVSLMVGFIIGMNNSGAHFLLFLIIVVYRTVFPFRYAFTTVITTNIAMVATVGWMFTVPGVLETFYDKSVGFELSAVDFFANNLLFPLTIFLLFWAVNYLVNQRNILESYLTNTVLARYLPTGLVAEAAKGNLDFEHEPETRAITILFVDLVGFTRMSQEMGAKGVSKVINRFINEVSELAHYQGGTIDKFIGDCVMVFFGAPDSMTPQAQAYRCVEMARRVQERFDEIDWGADLKIRVGIASGDVVVGHFGSNVRSDYTVLGPAVNLAARLESVCTPGDILVSDQTVQLLDDAFEFKKVGPLNLKGVGDDVYAWEFVG